MTRKTLTAIITLTLALTHTADAGTAAPDGLMTELLRGPAVNDITDAHPEFSWIVRSSEKNDSQAAYRILVASDPKMLAQDKADMWDSEKQESSNSINVSYDGAPLASSRSYCWKVKTWSKKGGESPWSKVMTFKTGKLDGTYRTTRHPLQQSVIAPSTIVKKGDRHYLIDFGKVAFGHLQLDVTSPNEGLVLEVLLGERGSGKGVNRKPGGTVRFHRITQTLKEGRNKLDIHPPRDKRNTGRAAIKLPKNFGIVTPFRYVELINFPVALDKTMIRQIAVHYAFDDTAATFISSNKILNDIWDLCKYSMKATSFCGVYVDGDRERIPYEADAYINQLSHYAVDRDFSLARYSHEYLLKHPTWPTEWKQHSVMMAWADYMYTGDTESLAEHYATLKGKKTLEQRARPDGLLNTKGMRDIVDWPKGERDGYQFKPVNTVVNAFYYLTLLQMADMADGIDKQSDAAAYRSKAEKLKAVFNTVLFDAKRGIYVDGEGTAHASLHANMMPLAFGLVPKEHEKSVADFVVSRGMACSVYGAQYLMEALYRAGRQNEAFALLTSKDIRSWYNMLRVGSTITLEAWDNKFKGNQDWNHAWGAAPGNIIPRYLLGIRPLEAGFGKILVRPMPGPLQHAEAIIPSIRGPIGIKLENTKGKGFLLEVTIPANMTARVEIPLPGGKGGVTQDGTQIQATAVDGFAVIENVGSGTHRFVTTEAVP